MGHLKYLGKEHNFFQLIINIFNLVFAKNKNLELYILNYECQI